MNATVKLAMIACAISLTAIAPIASTSRAEPSPGPLRAGRSPAETAGDRPGSDDMLLQDREALQWVIEFGNESAAVMEKWLSTSAISEDQLFARLYFPIPKTDPPKYSTDYDQLADRDLPAIQERMVGKSTAILYAIVTDVNGYVPTHNQRYAQPLTGNRAVDLVNNRTKRIFLDRAGFMAARSEAPHLLQRYQRDTGERTVDLSAPIRIRGKHWGCVRLGYRQIDK